MLLWSDLYLSKICDFPAQKLKSVFCQSELAEFKACMFRICASVLVEGDQQLVTHNSIPSTYGGTDAYLISQ